MPRAELLILGNASQAATTQRNTNGCALFWGEEALLFDPGEGSQRQLALAGVSVAQIRRILISHFHPDHCLGLPGIAQQMLLSGIEEPVPVYFPASGSRYFENLLGAASFEGEPPLVARPLPVEVSRTEVGPLVLTAGPLEHSVDTLGFRLEGSLEGDTRIFAFLMDTRPCAAAIELATGADLLVCEATYLEARAELAQERQHMTPRQAAEIAVAAGARRLLLSHFSPRYAEVNAFLHEARPHFPAVEVARDLARFAFP